MFSYKSDAANCSKHLAPTQKQQQQQKEQPNQQTNKQKNKNTHKKTRTNNKNKQTTNQPTNQTVAVDQVKYFQLIQVTVNHLKVTHGRPF